jgi:hypothetical protein
MHAGMFRTVVIDLRRQPGQSHERPAEIARKEIAIYALPLQEERW